MSCLAVLENAVENESLRSVRGQSAPPQNETYQVAATRIMMAQKDGGNVGSITSKQGYLRHTYIYYRQCTRTDES